MSDFIGWRNIHASIQLFYGVYLGDLAITNFDLTDIGSGEMIIHRTGSI
jgi:hypothetical protein